MALSSGRRNLQNVANPPASKQHTAGQPAKVLASSSMGKTSSSRPRRHQEATKVDRHSGIGSSPKKPRTIIRLRQRQTSNSPAVPEKAWWTCPQSVDLETWQRTEAEAKEQVRQDWMRRLRPRAPRNSSIAEIGSDKASST